jgi:hypothetical protein
MLPICSITMYSHMKSFPMHFLFHVRHHQDYLVHFCEAPELANAAELEEEPANVDPKRNTARSTAVDKVKKDTFFIYILDTILLIMIFYHIIEVWL